MTENVEFEFKVKFGLEIRIQPKFMVEFGHEVIEFGQKLTFWLKNNLFAKNRLPFAQNMNTGTKKLLFLDKRWPKLVEFG